MNGRPEYEAPVADTMRATQNTTTALRLLLIQRRIYRRAKLWQGVRWFGVLLLAVAAPFIALLVPAAAVIVGAVAGAWLFVGRTLLTWAETSKMTAASCIQEDFDLLVFEMPRSIERSGAPSPEDRARVGGDESRLAAYAAQEELPDWYDFGVERAGARAVAIAQRSNAAYTAGLIRTVLTLWISLAVVWFTALVVWASLTNVDLAVFLLGVFLPVLPSLLDVIEYLTSTRRAGRDRADLARAIETRLRTPTTPIEGADLMVWQERLFDLRRTTPQVPDWLYKLTRKANERAMRAAARDLSA